MTRALRLADARDAAAIAAIYAPYVRDTAITFEEAVPSPEQFASRMEGRSEHPWIVACEGAEVIGYAYSWRHRERASYRWSVDVSVYMDRNRRRLGVGRALYTALLQALRGLGFARAYAGITLPNPASVGLHEAMGFTLVGVYEGVGYKMGQWRDVGWWTLALSECEPGPREPSTMEELIASGRWQACLESAGRLLGDG